MRGGLVGAIAVALVLVGAVAAVAEKAKVGTPDQAMTGAFTVAPTALPRAERAPAALTVDLGYPSGTGSPQEQITFSLDRNLALDFRGFPVCRSEPGRIYSEPPPLERCQAAIVGRGEAAFEIAFPDRASVAEDSRLTVVNGGAENRVQTLFVHAEVSIPVPATVVMTLEIQRVAEGRYRTRATLSIPKVAGGAGSLTRLRLKFDRKARHGGRTDSVVSARCPDGKLQLRVDTLFADGTDRELVAARPCTSR